MLKVAKISVSCIVLVLCVYSLFNQNELLLLVVQLFVAALLSVVGVEAILSKQNTVWISSLLTCCKRC
ncbi:hypothetical protein STZ1_30023 [Bacillus subtilis]